MTPRAKTYRPRCITLKEEACQDVMASKIKTYQRRCFTLNQEEKETSEGLLNVDEQREQLATLQNQVETLTWQVQTLLSEREEIKDLKAQIGALPEMTSKGSKLSNPGDVLQKQVHTLTCQVEAILSEVEEIKKVQNGGLINTTSKGYKRKREEEDAPEFSCETHVAKDAIMGPLPPNIKVPVMKYCGLTDPRDHLESFKASMALQVQGAPDAIMCRAFAMTLREMALSWYMTLQPGSISSFRKLGELFVTRFTGSSSVGKTNHHLKSIRPQRENEELKDYMEHFNTEALQVGIFDVDLATCALWERLRQSCKASNALCRYLKLSRPQSFYELMALAERHIEADRRCRVKQERNGNALQLRRP